MDDVQELAINLSQRSFQVLEGLPTEVAILTADLRIAYMNEKLRELVGTENLGEKCYEVYQENLDKCKECSLSQLPTEGETEQAVCEGALGDKVVKFIHKTIKVDDELFVLEVWDDITKQRKAQDKLSWLASFPEKTPTPVLEWDERLNVTYQNPAAKEFSAQGSSSTHPLTPGDLDSIVDDLRKGEEDSKFRELNVGDKSFVEHIYLLPDEGVIRAYAYDITPRKEIEAKFHRSRRDLVLLTHCNQLLIRATDEEKLLEEICEAIVQIGGYCFAWVGYAEEDQEKTVKPVAQSGFSRGYLEEVKITWSGEETGQGPMGEAIREGQPSRARSIMSDSNFSPWRRKAVNRGYASSMALPLNYEDTTYGALGVYSTEPDAFEEREVELLRELADDLAFGIHAIRERERRRSYEQELQDLSKHLLDAHEEERNRISRELHDELGQLSTSIILALSNLKQEEFSQESAGWKEVEEVIGLVDRLDEKVRDLAVDLRPPALEELGLNCALKSDLAEIEKSQGVSTQLRADENVESILEPEDQVHLYRVAQEAINNALKHGDPGNISVLLRERADGVSLTLKDDGVGFDLEQLAEGEDSQQRLGLISMRERIYSMGGSIEIESSPGQGTTISVEIPIERS